MTITWDEFEKVEIQVGTIIEVRDFPKARKPAYQLRIDFGASTGVLWSSAQITKRYSQEDLLGKQVLAVVNFPAKQIANFISDCLVLGVMGTDGDVVLVRPDLPVENGLRLG